MQGTLIIVIAVFFTLAFLIGTGWFRRFLTNQSNEDSLILDDGSEQKIRGIGFASVMERIVSVARNECLALGSPQLSSYHLLLGILQSSYGKERTLLPKKGIEYKTLRKKLYSGNVISSETNIPLTPDATQALQASYQEAELRGDKMVQPIHLLLAILNNPQSPVADDFAQAGITYESLQKDLGRVVFPSK